MTRASSKKIDKRTHFSLFRFARHVPVRFVAAEVFKAFLLCVGFRGFGHTGLDYFVLGHKAVS